jgi:hypothetical protein
MTRWRTGLPKYFRTERFMAWTEESRGQSEETPLLSPFLGRGKRFLPRKNIFNYF